MKDKKEKISIHIFFSPLISHSSLHLIEHAAATAAADDDDDNNNDDDDNGKNQHTFSGFS